MSEISEEDSIFERADNFSKLFENASYESGQAQSFIFRLCEVYGISTYRTALFEERVAKDNGGINPQFIAS